MGSWSMFGGECEIAWFTDADRADRIERIRAVVVQRRTPRSNTGASLWSRALAILSRPRRSDGLVAPAVSPPGPWNSSVGSPGAAQVLYSRERAVIAVQGREFPLSADGRALLVFVEDRGIPSETLVRTHLVNSPTVERPSIDAPASREDRRERMRAHMQQQRATWHRWLDEQPLIQEFVTGKPFDGPPGWNGES